MSLIKPPDLPRVKKAGDGWLFLIGGSNSVMNLCSPSTFASSVDVAGWAERVKARELSLQKMSIRYRMLIVPEKLSVIGMLEPFRSALFDNDAMIEPPGSQFTKHINSHAIIYPLNFLRNQYNLGYNIFPKTDSHWAWPGALSAFQCVVSSLGYGFSYADYLSIKRNALNYKGDLWEESFIDVAAERFEKMLTPDWLHRVYANSLVGFKEAHKLTNAPGLHSGSHCIFINDRPASSHCLILFGSSFSDYRLTANMMTASFAAHFKVVHFVWSTDIDFDYVARIKPDVVVTEIPERFLTMCPKDDLNIEAFASARLSRWQQTNPA